MLPAYPAVLAGVNRLREVLPLIDGGRILGALVPDSYLPIYLFDQPDLFNLPGGHHQDADRHDWPDNHRRFAACCHAVTTLALHGDGVGWASDLVHAHNRHARLRVRGRDDRALCRLSAVATGCCGRHEGEQRHSPTQPSTRSQAARLGRRGGRRQSTTE